MGKGDKQYQLGLALSGGGVRGFAHIGALRALEEYGIKPDVIAGVSAGSIVAVLYASGKSPDEIFDRLTSTDLKEFFQVDLSKTGFLKLDKLREFLQDVLPVKNIEDLNIPTIIGATDIDNQCEHPFTRGEITERVAASCSLPIVFRPVEVDGVNYVDGGVLHNLPSYYLRPLCDKVIGVNVSPSLLGKTQLKMSSLAYRVYKIMTRQNVIADKALCDLLIDITSIQHIGTFEINQANKIASISYFETVKILQNSDIL